MSHGRAACVPPPLGWQRAQSSSHPSERKCRVHSSMSPNTEKRCRSSDRVILLGILPMNTTRRSSCGQGAPCREPGPGGGPRPARLEGSASPSPCVASHPPHHELAGASPRRCPRARRPTHYCTFLLEDPLPLVVVLCVVTVPGEAESGPVSSRVLEESDPRTRTQGRCPRCSPPRRVAVLTVSSCYSSCGEKGTGTGTVCGTGTWTSRRRRRRRTRTCPGTCHTTHSWSGRRSCANILSGTCGEERDSSAPSPPRAQHQAVLRNKETSILPRAPSTSRTHQHPQGEPGYGNACPSLPGDAKAPQRHCSARPQSLQGAASPGTAFEEQKTGTGEPRSVATAPQGPPGTRAAVPSSTSWAAAAPGGQRVRTALPTGPFQVPRLHPHGVQHRVLVLICSSLHTYQPRMEEPCVDKALRPSALGRLQNQLSTQGSVAREPPPAPPSTARPGCRGTSPRGTRTPK